MASGLPLSSHVPRSEHAFNWWPNAYLHCTTHPKNSGRKQFETQNAIVLFDLEFVFCLRKQLVTHIWWICLYCWEEARLIVSCLLMMCFMKHALWFSIKWFLLRSVLLCTRCLWFSGRRVSVWRWSVEISLQCSWGHLVDKSWTSPSCRFSPLPTRASAWAS